MKKGMTSPVITVAAALLSTTFLVAAPQAAQARPHHGIHRHAVHHGKVHFKKHYAKKKAHYRRHYTRGYGRKHYRHARAYTAGRRIRAEIDTRSGTVFYPAEGNSGAAWNARTTIVARDPAGNDASPYANNVSAWGNGWFGGGNSGIMNTAQSMVGMSARGNRHELKRIFANTLAKQVDPTRTPWCAAWANSVLAQRGIQGTNSLLARSFLNWGHATSNPGQGDVAVLTRGRGGISGHVGFVVERKEVNGRRFVKLLGGNQGRAVKYSWYPESKVISYRTASL